MNLIELAEQLRNVPQPNKTTKTKKPEPVKEWYKNGSTLSTLKRRANELFDRGIINDEDAWRIKALGERIAWSNIELKTTMHGCFDQLNNDPDTYITNNKTVNAILAATIKPGTKMANEKVYKTALSVIAQQNIAALKALHVYRLKANELHKLADATPGDFHMILLTNDKHELSLQDLYRLTLDQDYKIMPTYSRHNRLDDDCWERAITACREEVDDNIEIEYTYHQYRIAEINKTNGETTITYPTRLNKEQDNAAYRHCYFLC